MSRIIHVLGIDPQEDFANPNGALFVPGADDDMSRVAAMFRANGHKIADVHITLDCHNYNDIAHPSWFVDSSGAHPAPFMIVSADDLESGRWMTRVPSLRGRTLEYLRALDASGRYPHMIWPPHCLIGSSGCAVVPELMDALNEWCKTHFGVINWVSKGSNVFTEHFSGVQAEVPDPNDPTTQVNTDLVLALEEADDILLVGEALSHCLANTVRDIAANFSDPALIAKLVLLTDASSPVTGCEQFATDFINEMTPKGMRTSTTVDFFA